MKKIELKVEGMVCSGCEKRVCNVLKMVDGVKKVKASYKNGNVLISPDLELNLQDITNKIEDLGFKVVEED